MSRIDWRRAKTRDTDPANTIVPTHQGIESDVKAGRKAAAPKGRGFEFPKPTPKVERAFPDARDGSFKGKNGGRWPKKP